MGILSMYRSQFEEMKNHLNILNTQNENLARSLKELKDTYEKYKYEILVNSITRTTLLLEKNTIETKLIQLEMNECKAKYDQERKAVEDLPLNSFGLFKSCKPSS